MTLIQLFFILLLAIVVIFLVYFIIHYFVAPEKTDGIQTLLKQGKVSSAIKLAKRLLNNNPDDYHAHYYLGKAYLADNRPELALLEYKIVNKKAIFSTGLSELTFRKESAQLYKQFNRDKEALQEYILLTKLDPSNSDFFYNAGILFEKSNKTEQALIYYEKAILLNKKNGKAHSAKGRLLYRTKQYSEAKKELDIAVTNSPNIFENYYYLGKILKEAKDYPSAINYFEKSLRDPAYKVRSYIERGSCYMYANREDKAVLEFEKAINSSKNDSSKEMLYAKYFLAATYEKQHKLEKALKLWQSIFSVDHSFKDVASKLATYSDLQHNDNMKEYLTSNTDNFVEICKKTAEQAMHFSIKQGSSTSFGARFVVTETNKNNWMNIRQQLILLLFYRDPDLIKDTIPRKLIDDMKKNNCVKGIICTSSDFTRSAKTFAESRPIELINREKLENILSKISVI
ncbi:MAG: restriction endonuclease [Treponema sp. CETP13]|nr:MAG: restriction endonuclease [Treponema sp. CETP13]